MSQSTNARRRSPADRLARRHRLENLGLVILGLGVAVLVVLAIAVAQH